MPVMNDRPDAGRPDYNPSYLAYIDVLGWKGIIEQIGTDFDRFDDILGVYSALASHEREDGWIKEIGDEGFPVNLPPPQHLVASDTIILSTTDDENSLFSLLVRCGKICADLLGRGFLTRGAIVRGLLYHQGHVIFGEALTGAYLQERKSARYPRVLIAEDVVKRLANTGPLKGPWAKSTYNSWFRRDLDGFLRLNLFANFFAPSERRMTDYMADAASAIVRTLAEYPPTSEEFAKAHWLAEVYNIELGELTRANLIDATKLAPIDLSALRDRS